MVWVGEMKGGAVEVEACTGFLGENLEVASTGFEDEH